MEVKWLNIQIRPLYLKLNVYTIEYHKMLIKETFPKNSWERSLYFGENLDKLKGCLSDLRLKSSAGYCNFRISLRQNILLWTFYCTNCR